MLKVKCMQFLLLYSMRTGITEDIGDKFYMLSQTMIIYSRIYNYQNSEYIILEK